MKHIYSASLRVVLFGIFLQFFSDNIYAQTCPNSGASGTVAYDTIMTLPPGTYNTQVKFPQFDPNNGMVTCVKLCVTLIGIIDSVAMENIGNTSQTATIRYIRTDGVNGPGFTAPPYTTSINFTGPHLLQPTDGVAGSGPDFYSKVKDTVLNNVVCRTISDSTQISNFYGNGDVNYDYSIDAVSYVSGNGSLTSYIQTSAKVRFRFEYCTCPSTALPANNINLFTADKITDDKAELKWSGFDQRAANYHYEAQVSKNPYNDFNTIGSFDVNQSGADNYRTVYQVPTTEKGNYYFRIRQVYNNGYVRYSEVRKVTLESSGAPKFSLFPNPSKGRVGIKFDNNSSGHYNVQIFNTQGQLVFSKDIIASGTANVDVTTMKDGGAYVVRVVDVKTRLACVNQILIK